MCGDGCWAALLAASRAAEAAQAPATAGPPIRNVSRPINENSKLPVSHSDCYATIFFEGVGHSKDDRLFLLRTRSVSSLVRDRHQPCRTAAGPRLLDCNNHALSHLSDRRGQQSAAIPRR